MHVTEFKIYDIYFAKFSFFDSDSSGFDRFRFEADELPVYDAFWRRVSRIRIQKYILSLFLPFVELTAGSACTVRAYRKDSRNCS